MWETRPETINRSKSKEKAMAMIDEYKIYQTEQQQIELSNLPTLPTPAKLNAPMGILGHTTVPPPQPSQMPAISPQTNQTNPLQAPAPRNTQPVTRNTQPETVPRTALSGNLPDPTNPVPRTALSGSNHQTPLNQEDLKFQINDYEQNLKTNLPILTQHNKIVEKLDSNLQYLQNGQWTGTQEQHRQTITLQNNLIKFTNKYKDILSLWNEEGLSKHKANIEQYNKNIKQHNENLRQQPIPYDNGSMYAGEPPEEPSLLQKIGKVISPLFTKSPEERQAQKANILAISEETGIPLSIVSENYKHLARKIGKETFATQPTAEESLSKLMLMPITAGLVANPVGTLTGLATFATISEIENAVISKITGKKYQFGAGKGLKDLIPDVNKGTESALDIIDFVGTALIAKGVYKTAPKLAEKFTKNTIDAFKLPKTVTISPAEVKAAQIDPSGMSAEKLGVLKELGLKSNQWKIALKNGLEVEIPAQNLIKIVDKPYWSKIKTLFKLKPTDRIISTKNITKITPKVPLSKRLTQSNPIVPPAPIIPPPATIQPPVINTQPPITQPETHTTPPSPTINQPPAPVTRTALSGNQPETQTLPTRRRLGKKQVDKKITKLILSDILNNGIDYLDEPLSDVENPFEGMIYRGASKKEWTNILKGSRPGSFWANKPSMGHLNKDRIMIMAKDPHGKILSGRDEIDYNMDFKDIQEVYAWNKDTKLWGKIYDVNSKDVFFDEPIIFETNPPPAPTPQPEPRNPKPQTIDKIGKNTVIKTGDTWILKDKKGNTKPYSEKQYNQHLNRSESGKKALNTRKKNKHFIDQKFVDAGDMPALKMIQNVGVSKKFLDENGKPYFEQHYDQLEGILIGKNQLGSKAPLNTKSEKFEYDDLEISPEYIATYGKPKNFDEMLFHASQEVDVHISGNYNPETFKRLTDEQIENRNLQDQYNSLSDIEKIEFNKNWNREIEISEQDTDFELFQKNIIEEEPTETQLFIQNKAIEELEINQEFEEIVNSEISKAYDDYLTKVDKNTILQPKELENVQNDPNRIQKPAELEKVSDNVNESSGAGKKEMGKGNDRNVEKEISKKTAEIETLTTQQTKLQTRLDKIDEKIGNLSQKSMFDANESDYEALFGDERPGLNAHREKIKAQKDNIERKLTKLTKEKENLESIQQGESTEDLFTQPPAPSTQPPATKPVPRTALSGNKPPIIKESEFNSMVLVDESGNQFKVQVNLPDNPNSPSGSVTTYEILKTEKGKRKPQKMVSVHNEEAVNRVLKDYAHGKLTKKPAPIPKPKAGKKDHFQTTLAEYTKKRLGKIKNPTPDQVKGNEHWAKEEHQKFIKQALSEGKTPYKGWEKDYPDLQPTPQKPVPRTALSGNKPETLEKIPYEKDSSKYADPATAQKLINSIMSGETKLKTGKNKKGEEYSQIGLNMIQRAVDDTKKRLSKLKISDEKKVKYSDILEYKPEDIDYELAKRAYYNISFSPEKRAVQTQKDYTQTIENMIEKMSEFAKSPRQKQILQHEMERFKKGLLSKTNAWLSTKSRTYSVMITGPANFNNRRHEKANNAEHNKMEDLIQFIEKAEKSIKKTLIGAKTREEINTEINNFLKNEIQSTVATIKGIEAGTDHSNKTAFTVSLSSRFKRMIKNGQIDAVLKAVDYLKELEQKHLKKPVFSPRNGIWKLIETAKTAEPVQAPKGETILATHEGIEIKNNYDAERVQIFFEDIPSEEIRNSLKRSGWKWSKFHGAWQRKNTLNAIRNAHNQMEIIQNHLATRTSQPNNPTAHADQSTYPPATSTKNPATSTKKPTISPDKSTHYTPNLEPLIELPEIIEFQKLITSGKIPKVAEKLGRARVLGLARGTESEILAELAIGHHLETTFHDSKPNIEVIEEDFLENNPSYIGDKLHTTIKYDTRNKQYKVKIFQVDPTLAPRVILHELGHIIDYVPDNTTKRGNILGRIASVNHQFRKHVLPNKPGAEGELTKNDRARLRRLAKKELGDSFETITIEIKKEIPLTTEEILSIWRDTEASVKSPELNDYIASLSDKEKVSIMKEALKGNIPDWVSFKNYVTEIETKEIKLNANPENIRKKYQELIKEEIKKRKLFQLEQMMDELKDLTHKWKPFNKDNDPSYTKYRYSSVELYADGISALFTDPLFLKKTAPSFFNAFFNYLDLKPKVKSAYGKILDQLNLSDTERMNNRMGKSVKGFQEHREIIDQNTKRQLTFKKLWTDTLKGLVNRNIDLKRIAKNSDPDKNPYIAALQIPHIASNAFLYVRDIENNCRKPVESIQIPKSIQNSLKGIVKTDPKHRTTLKQDILGFYTQLIRSSTERKYLFNPLGYDQKNAQKDIRILKEQLGADNFSQLEKAVSEYTKIRKEHIFPILQKAQMYDDEFMQHLVDNKNYFTFSVTKYMKEKFAKSSKGSLTAKIYEQIGTFEKIGNPFTATVLKDIALINGAVKNIAAKATVDFYLDPANNLFDQIEPAKRGKGGQLIIVDNDVTKTLVYLHNGKQVGYNLPAHVVEGLSQNKMHQIFEAGSWLLSKLNRLPREIWIGKNPFWALITNLPRDFKRTYINNEEIKFGKLLANYFKYTPSAINDVFFGKTTPKIRELYKQTGRLAAYRQWMEGREKDETQLDQLIKQFETAPQKYGKIRNPLKLISNLLSDIGEASEKLGQIAGTITLEEAGVKRQELAHRSMAQVGTPNLTQKGGITPLTNQAFVFSNAGFQGWEGDIDSAERNPRSYLMRSFVHNVVPKMLMFAAGSGALYYLMKKIYGEDSKHAKNAQWLQDAFSKIPEYDKANYHCIPIGETESGKIVYIIQPPDFVGKLLSGAVWKGLNSVKDKKLDLSDLLSFFDNEVPLGTVSPGITLGMDTHQYLTGNNIWDKFRGKTGIPDKKFNSGSEWEKFKAFISYEWNNTFGHYIYKFNDQEINKVESKLEKSLKTPLLGQGLRRFIRVSDRGSTEKFMSNSKSVDAKENYANLKIDRHVAKTLRNASTVQPKHLWDFYEKLQTDEKAKVSKPKQFLKTYSDKYAVGILSKHNNSFSTQWKISNQSIERYLKIKFEGEEPPTQARIKEEVKIIEQKLKEISDRFQKEVNSHHPATRTSQPEPRKFLK